MRFAKRYIKESIVVLRMLDADMIDILADEIATIRHNHARLFVVGVGGSAATASHAVNDFRKIGRIEAYTPTDNVAELTARTNDDGWENTFSNWLDTSHMKARDGLLVLSVGGGNKSVSQNIVHAVDFANSRGAMTMGIVSRNGGHTLQHAKHCLVIPPLYEGRITPHAEGLTSVILHLLVSHPSIR